MRKNRHQIDDGFLLFLILLRKVTEPSDERV